MIAAHIYQRGAMLWWRRRLPCQFPHFKPIMIRLSLKTGCGREAKRRAAVLEAASHEVTTMINVKLNPGITPKQMRKLAHLAYKTALDRNIAKQMATPQFENAHLESNLLNARYFSLMTHTDGLPTLSDDFFDGLWPTGASASEICGLAELIKRYGETPPINPSMLKAYLREVGVPDNLTNAANVLKIVAAAYSKACIDASAALNAPMPEGAVDPLPRAFHDLFSKPAEPVVVAQPSQMQPSPSPSPSSSPQPPPPPQPINDGKIDATISQVADAAILAKVKDGTWRIDRRRDVEASLALFKLANGDLLMSEIQQHHLNAMFALFSEMPTIYGHHKGDREGGMPAILARGKVLAQQWRDDPIKCEENNVPSVGFGPATHNKHKTWIRQIFIWAKGNNYIVPALDFDDIKSRRDKRRKNAKRPVWSKEDLKTLISGPIWTGAKSLASRFRPGSMIVHDGSYWGPLIIVSTGMRSSEAIGMSLAEVYENAPIPYFHLKATAYRKLKNDASSRKIPICQQLIDLGFIDYVRAMRDNSQKLLFPEFYNPEQSMGFDKIFLAKCFSRLRDHHFPRAQTDSVDKRADVHSIRHRVGSELRDAEFMSELRIYFMGHEQSGTTQTIYEDDPEPHLLLPLANHLGTLFEMPAKMPLNLRPSFGENT